jgi:hypothetical protein
VHGLDANAGEQLLGQLARSKNKGVRRYQTEIEDALIQRLVELDPNEVWRVLSTAKYEEIGRTSMRMVGAADLCPACHKCP